jgi:HEPN domain-containing protein
LTSRAPDWLRQARHSLESARWSNQGDFFDDACFKSQQAAELAVKALLETCGVKYTGHSVSQGLFSLPRALVPDIPEEARAAAQELDGYYRVSRYPDAHATGAPVDYVTAGDAEEAIRHVAVILAFVEDAVGRLSGP